MTDKTLSCALKMFCEPFRRRTTIVLCLCAAALNVAGCGAGGKLPAKSSKEYAETVSAFYTGLAALQEGDDVTAESKNAQVTQLAPGEPAGWANWGVLAFRQRNFDAAAQRYERARELAPKNDQIYYLLGILQSTRGNSREAIADWRKAVAINPQNYRAAYQLAQEVEREGGSGSDAEFESLMQNILKAQPDNLAAWLELARAAAKRGDAATLQSALANIKSRAAQWPPEVQEQLAALTAAAAAPDTRGAATRTTFLRNALMRVAEFRESLAVLQAAPGEEAEPFTHFLRLEAPAFIPAPADTALTFAPQPLSNPGAKHWEWIGAVPLGSAGPPVVGEANGREVRLSTGATFPFPGGATGVAPLPDGILPIDFNYDFNNDLVLAGAGGVRLMRQDNPKLFTDVTAQAKLPLAVTRASYTGAWAVDIEADGDLDIVLGAKEGLPLVLRNNGDGTFTAIHPFAGVSGLRAFAWADFDGDGNPDAALVDGAGHLHVFHNERQAQFRELPLSANLPLVKALNVADVDDDGVLDLLAVQADGAIVRISDEHEGQVLNVAEIARVPAGAGVPDYLSGEVRLGVADLDNNGALDLFLTPASLDASRQTFGGLVWLADEKGKFVLLEHPFGQAAPALISDAADLGGNGRLDLLALSADGQALQAVNHGAKNYHWQVVRPHAKQAVGDQRINPFGVGGEIEIRSGMLVQKQPITGPQVHFGLGNQTSTDVVRVVWPNGTVRAEFGVAADTEVVTEQRLKASCPFLFAYNGKGMEFIKDAVPWGSAIGLRINTIGTARVETTGEWYKIRRDQLVPHDGYYDLRVTAELWEVYYYDYLALMTVDHPAGTEIYVDERFSIPPPKLGVTTVATPHKIVHAIDDTGRDVTNLVDTLDGKALDDFGRGQYQGITRDHYLEVDLGDDAPKSGPLYLIGQGSIHDTESSLNVAITQGHRWRA
jgi:Tfp pilus assembly protein PilF